MRVDYAFVAEAADSQGGLFSLVRGGADIYFLPRGFPKPLHIPAISFVVRMTGEQEEIGQQLKATCRIVDTQGQPGGFNQEVEMRFDQHPIDPGRTTGNVIAFRFYGMQVPDFGTYFFEVQANDLRLAQVPFWVVPVDVPEPDGGWGTGLPQPAPDDRTGGYL